MRGEWSPEELVGAWTLVEGDWRLLGNKSGATRLGFALLLKFFELEGRFPAYPEEIPSAAVEYVAGLVKVDAALFVLLVRQSDQVPPCPDPGLVRVP